MHRIFDEGVVKNCFECRCIDEFDQELEVRKFRLNYLFDKLCDIGAFQTEADYDFHLYGHQDDDGLSEASSCTGSDAG